MGFKARVKGEPRKGFSLFLFALFATPIMRKHKLYLKGGSKMYNVGEYGNENIKEVRLLFDMTKVRKVVVIGVVALLGVLYGASTHKVTTTADRNLGNGQYGVIRETHTEDIFGRQIDESEIEVLGYVNYNKHHD